MTCEEVRRIISTTRVVDTTRAQRSAMSLHIDKCPACELFISQGKMLPLGDPTAIEIIKTIQTDLSDPEYTG